MPARLFDNGMVAMKACRHGALMYPANDSFVGRALDLYGEWCESEIELFATLLAPGDVVVDVGANIGTHTVFFAKHVGPEGRVVALEPQRFVHGLLVANVAASGLANVECLLAAASAEEGTVAIPVVDPRAACNFGAIGVASNDAGRGAGRARHHRRARACALLAAEDRRRRARDDGARGRREDDRSSSSDPVRGEQHRRALGGGNPGGPGARLSSVLAHRAVLPEGQLFGNAEDVFAPYQPEANLVCVPKERELPACSR